MTGPKSDTKVDHLQVDGCSVGHKPCPCVSGWDVGQKKKKKSNYHSDVCLSVWF